MDSLCFLGHRPRPGKWYTEQRASGGPGGSLGCRHLSALRNSSPQQQGEGTQLNDSQALILHRCSTRKYRPHPHPAPSNRVLQPLCVPHTHCTSSHLGAFMHAAPFAWNVSLGSSHFKCHFFREASCLQLPHHPGISTGAPITLVISSLGHFLADGYRPGTVGGTVFPGTAAYIPGPR